MKMYKRNSSRREFLESSARMAALALISPALPLDFLKARPLDIKLSFLSGHVWVYASAFPPDWDCTPVLDTVFSDLAAAGFQGVELMESNLLHSDAVPRFRELIEQYSLPVTGASFYGDMWDREQQQAVLDKAFEVIDRLDEIGGKTFGISVGDPGRKKTEAELDQQAKVLQEILRFCKGTAVVPNMHNHTNEVAFELHDLKGTIERVPELKLGPDMNWLIRGGVDPVSFIHRYGEKMVYLHLRDQDAAGRWTEQLGQGVTDFPGIFQALRQVNFRGAMAIELAYDGPPVNPTRENWKVSHQYISRILSQQAEKDG